MLDQVHVTILKPRDRKFYMMRYTHPESGRIVTKTTKTTQRRKAERAAAKWEDDVRKGRDKSPSKTTWADFRDKYEMEVLPGLADATDLKVRGVFNTIERILNPTRLRDLTAERIGYLAAKLREGEPEATAADGIQTWKVAPRSENTIKGILAHLGAALRWAVEIGLLVTAPKIKSPRRAKGGKVMKGRPITGEEFDRMLAKVPGVVGEEAAESWRYYLRGLWLSGLRLGESLELYWDRDDKLCIDLSGKYPMLRIPAELEKGHKDRHLPIAPEFAEFLLQTPEHRRHGRVFNPQAQRVKGDWLTGWRISRLGALIGQAAGIKVQTDNKAGTVKFASAHDLRRSFGARWAGRVMPHVLRELMRHESIETTMKFYVGRNAQSTAELLWQATGNTFGNTSQEAANV